MFPLASINLNNKNNRGMIYVVLLDILLATSKARYRHKSYLTHSIDS